jgi:hypothetical protein
MTNLQFRTWPYVPDIITPAGQLKAVDCSKDAVQITVDPTVSIITPSAVVTISPEALTLLERALT